jgi:hypothetical protein
MAVDNGRVSDKPRCAISARRRTTAHITISSSVLCTGYVVNKTVSCVLRDMILVTYIITIVQTGLTTKKYVIVLSVLNLVSDFVKCNHPIGNRRLCRCCWYRSSSSEEPPLFPCPCPLMDLGKMSKEKLCSCSNFMGTPHMAVLYMFLELRFRSL